MLNSILRKFIRDKNLIEPVEFVIKVSLVYFIWRCLKYLGETYPGFLWGGWSWFYDFIGNLLANCDAAILSVLGYKFVHQGRNIVVEGARGIYFSDLCLGIAPLFIFSGIILLFGNNHKAKVWFIPMGLILIFWINVFRLLALILIQVHHKEYFQFAHEYLYVAVTYGIIFLMVIWWMNKLAFKK